MGQLEKEAKRLRRKGHVRDALLGALLVGGMVAIGAVPHLLPKPGGKRRAHNRSAYQKTVASQIVREGLAQWVEQNGKYLLRITEVGRRKLSLQQEMMKLKKTRRWDKRWRMVAFDLPERRRGARDSLRQTMAEAGFVRLQNSVWVYPYDCEEFIALLKADLKIGKDVLYAIVEKLENDKELRGHFLLT